VKSKIIANVPGEEGGYDNIEVYMQDTEYVLEWTEQDTKRKAIRKI
jgi:hypothetical protein